MKARDGLLIGLLVCALPAMVVPAATRSPDARADALEPARAALRTRSLGTALERLRATATGGNAEAQYLLGQMYLNGFGTAVDVAAARDWLRRAAEQNHAPAAFVLAAVLQRDPPADARAASDWLQRSAQAGYVRAVEALRDPRPLLAVERAMAGNAALTSDLALYAARRNDLALLQSLGTAATSVRDAFGRSALSAACEGNAVAAAQWLLGSGADPRQADRFGTTPLMLAARAATPELLQLLIGRGASAAAVDQQGRTALFYAGRSDRAAAIAPLAATGLPVAALDKRGYNALDVAVVAGAEAAAAELRRLGLRQTVTRAPRSAAGKFDPAKPGQIYRDWPTLALAVARNDADETRRLLAAGGSVGLRTPQGDTLMHVALHARSFDALQALLMLGADPLAADRRGRSVLGLSAAHADGMALQLLLSARINANGHAPKEAAPLIVAVRAGLRDNLAALLEAGARGDALDAAGDPALALAAVRGDAALLQLLLQKQVDVLQRNRDGQTALWQAARGGQLETTRLLLAARSDVEAADKDGRTPLMAAALGGNLAVVQLLIGARPRLDLVSNSGDSALLVAAAAGQLEIARELLRAGARPNLQNQHGDTALIAASRIGDEALCQLLLQSGASATLRNKDRSTAADMARDRGFAQLAARIEARG